MGPAAPRGLEHARQLRLQRTCEEKFPNLAIWKSDGARTVLVLEESDLSLNNHQLVTEALFRVLPAFSSARDEIFLVSTELESAEFLATFRRPIACARSLRATAP